MRWVLDFRSTFRFIGSFACVVVASLIGASPASGVAGYGDVAYGRYFTEPVQWSVDNDITGIDGACFSPDAAVSRGEAAVYLWAMAGRPSTPAHSFVDVTDDGQNAAVSWMSHNSITTGTTETTFDPDAILTRAHLVTFLWRIADEPEAPSHRFVDVHRPWQQVGVSWASHTQITTGTSATTFAPDATLTRAHVVTFLWRYHGEPQVTVDAYTPICDPTGTTEPPPPPDAIGEFVSVSAGSHTSCGLKTDGTIACWGSNRNGEAHAPVGEFITISTGSGHSCALRTDGTIACWGSNDYGETEPPAGEFTSVSVGAAHSCGVHNDGTIACWGWNDSGQSDPPVGEFTTVSGGFWHTCGVRADRTIDCWGSNYYGQTAVPAGEFTAVSATQRHSCGLHTNGAIVCWGDRDPSGTRGNAAARTDAPAGEFVSVSAGDLYSCGVRTSGAVECWGFNNNPHLGTVGQLQPPAGPFSAVSAGFSHACGLRTNGTIECWGDNDSGQTDGPLVDLFQAVYVVPSDKAPMEGLAPAIAHELAVVQSWYDSQTGGTHPVFVREGDAISVVTVGLPGSLAEFDTVGKIVSEIRPALPAVGNQHLVLYVEGQLTSAEGEVTACGWASNHVVIPMDNCDIRPVLGSNWPYGATYLLAHELAHVLGAVPECAPNHGYSGHALDDRRDLLYAGAEGRDWDNLVLDFGNDDYYNHGREDCFDIADSPLLGSE